MTEKFPELILTGTLTLENLNKYALDRRIHDYDGPMLRYGNLRKDLGDYLLEHAIYPEDESIDSNPGGTQAERRMWMRGFLWEEGHSEWPSIWNEPKDHRAWLRKHLDLVDFMVDIHGNQPTVIMQRYGAAVYNANMDQLWGEQLDVDEAAKQLIIEAVKYAVREIVAECDGVVASMEPYMEELKAAIKGLMKVQRNVSRY
ncbi:hypothetical protein J4E93_009165 [Alternaria ventricosa]|uniref:uncharacterized protein n=1 Tax=Alternaria ventricosa TaxID=1187951 RepID=UPI0020C3D158|nr:uncharacterized protein J4E93_009165 [Alternaria ventricosa]KAI4639811.1 hypothetical protein J4E93_009165 [Alternaria ventricosa]